MRSTIPFIVACFLLLSLGTAPAAERCRDCHRIIIGGIHGELPCLACHLDESKTVADPASAEGGAIGCVGCHKGYAALFSHAMGTRSGERAFVERSFAKGDPAFFEKKCNSCHLRGCTDCHGGKGHRLEKAGSDACLACHKGYFVGWDYFGRAPREDSLRYQRGEEANGEHYLKMTPDVHAGAGLGCGSCHSMTSLAAGKSSSKGCLECHKVNRKVVEHRIAAHLEKMECYACHAAWAPQEYGTFYLRFAESPSQDRYRVRENDGEYVKSAYLRKQDAPPLGINGRGKVSPIRPQFIGYFTEIRNDRAVGEENRLVAAEWKAFFPHTIRRGSVLCEGCHDTPRRFILEKEEERIYDLQKDGMTLRSFWDREGQRVVNGGFLPLPRYRLLTTKSPSYQRAYLEKWQRLINRVENSSPR